MKNQALFSSKDKSKKLKCLLLQFFFWRFKGRFLGYRRYHNFANSFSKLLESTFHKEISKFQ